MKPGLYWAHWSEPSWFLSNKEWLMITITYSEEVYMFYDDGPFKIKQFKDFQKIELKNPDGEEWY